MSLSNVSIHRPVLAIVMSIAIVIFGMIGLRSLGVREYPSVDPPLVTVTTNYTGANADVIESQITEPLETSINGIAGIRSLTSASRDGRSSITVEFNLNADLEAAANDVRDRVSRATGQLPADADPPIVSKADADASPIVFLSLKSDTRDLLSLSEIANNLFKERIQTIPGVSEVRIWGERRYSMRLWMDPAKLAAYGLTATDVRNAVTRENVELPTGRIEGDATELSIRTSGLLSSEDEFNNTIIKDLDGQLVRFKDVGYAMLGSENERTILRRDGIPMVGIAVTPQPGSNNIAIADEFYRRIEQIKKDVPADIEMGYGFDITTFIRKSITEVEETILIAFALVIMIIFLFLRDWRTTVIPAAAIPISLIGTFFIMYVVGFTINVLTLLGIVLAIGIVVDDAIVVLENIYAKVEAGRSPMEAAIVGSKEIFFAIVSTTAALAAVFLPIIFLQGLTGRLFTEFGVVLAGSVIISAFVALTLTPMMASRILKPHAQHSRFYRATEPFFVRMNANYAASLDWFLKHRSLAFVVMAVTLGLIILVGANLKRELSPLEDRSAMRLQITGPEGTSFEAMDQIVTQLVDLVRDTAGAEAKAVVSVTSPGFGSSTVNTGFIRLMLVDPDQRSLSQQQIANKLASGLTKMNDARTIVVQEQTIGGGGRGGGLPVQYVIQAPNFERLREVLPKFLEEARADETFQSVDVNLKFNKPELRVEIDRERARVLGVSMLDVAQTLQFALSGQRFGYFIRDGKQYQIIGQVQRYNRDEPLDLKALYVRNSRGELIQLDNIVTVTEQSNPPQLYRFNRYVSATVSAALAPGRTLGEGIAAMDAVKEKVLDETFQTALDGTSKEFAESSSSLEFAFILALILIYLILAAQFESFRDPFVILLTVPLALAGALISLWYFNQTINIFSQIGMIMLIGLVTKNGILIVEFANQRREQGLTKFEAVREASIARFRPILMTSLSTTLGTLPIALALGAGAESRVSMGIAVVGGLILSTVMTLFVIPALYTYVSSHTLKASDLIEVEEQSATAERTA
ncbi:MAG: efflux RND transporter permease subunit [bacterium]|nr:efflux RND transporter permease subunit [bacterium]